MSNLARRRNPAGAVKSALVTNAVVGGGGAAIGAATASTGSRGAGAFGGVQTGLGLTSLGGLIVGLVSQDHRNAAFATAGVGLLGLVGLGLYNRFSAPATPAAATTSP